MLKLKKTLLIAFAFLTTLHTIAQAVAAPVVKEEKGFMRSEGKIYVVMVVVITILSGLLFYITRLDKKISKIEKGNLS